MRNQAMVGHSFRQKISGVLQKFKLRSRPAILGHSTLNQVERKLADTNQMLHSLFELNPQPVMVTNVHGIIVRTNAAARQLCGYSYEQIQDEHYDRVVTEEERKKLGVYYQQALKGVPQAFETAILHMEGYKIEISVTAIPVRAAVTAEVHELVLILQDITSSKRALERIKFVAYYDDMTGIPNRRFFREHLENALHLAARNKTSIAVLILDIDRFKLFNDSFGHNVGDMLLLQVTERLIRCVSSHDVLARMEGDEFAIFYTDAGSVSDIEVSIAAIRLVLEQPFECQGYNLTITMSIGISVNEDSQIDADHLMKCADIALSRAKEIRNNHQFYSSSMEIGTLDRLTMESDLHSAIQKEEFVLYYQPQVNIVSGDIIGVEGLIRWNHPDRGLVLPGEFISLAEENGTITLIGEQVIEMACKQAVQWQKEGLPHIPVSVNISVRQFLQPNLALRISEILTQTGLPAHLLELEITESVTSDVEYAQKVLDELKQLGVEICIDDFGTGYSSLSFLRKFPISRLKIDRSFVRDIMNDRSDAQIVETIIAMSRHLNMKVIAEGVENREQLLFLEKQQCYEAQGYLFARPMPGDQLAEWLRSR